MIPEDIIQQILSQHPEIGRQQLLDRLRVNRDMTGGLIADDSLLRMIAAELGVDVPNENGTFSRKLSLGHLVAGLNNATVTGRVVAVYPVRSFEGAKPGKFGSLTIVDNDGVSRVVLWNEKSSILETGELKVGQIVKFMHGYTKADRFGVPELHVGERSQVELNLVNVKDEDYPSIGKFTTKLRELGLEQKNVNVEATVRDVFTVSTFNRSDQSEGKVLRAKVADDSAEATVVFWNEKAEEFAPKLKKGMQIQLVNARTKPSQKGEAEIHVDSSVYVAVSEAQKRFAKVATLVESFGDIDVEGEVASLPVCKEIKTSKGEKVKLTSFDLRDDSGIVRVTAWREHADTAAMLFMGEKVRLENVYAKLGYNGKMELSTKTASTITKV